MTGLKEAKIKLAQQEKELKKQEQQREQMRRDVEDMEFSKKGFSPLLIMDNHLRELLTPLPKDELNLLLSEVFSSDEFVKLVDKENESNSNLEALRKSKFEKAAKRKQEQKHMDVTLSQTVQTD